MAISAYSGVEFSVEGGERIRMVLNKYAQEIIPLANQTIRGLLPKLEAIAITKARASAVPQDAIATIKARTFQMAGPMKPVLRVGGKTTIAIGFASVTELGGMQILRGTRAARPDWSNWRFNQYPAGRRLWQEEFGLAGTKYPESMIRQGIMAAGGKPWYPPPYSLFRGKDIGTHYLYGWRHLKRDKQGRFMPGLPEGPGKPPKGFLRASIREVAVIFSAEFAKILKKLYDERNLRAIKEAGIYGKKI